MSGAFYQEGNTFIAHGRGAQRIAEGIAAHLKLPILKQKIGEYEGAESFVEIEENCRDANIIFIGSPPYRTLKPNDVLMEYLFYASALTEAKVRVHRTLVPILPYARQDRTKGQRIALTSKVAIDTIMSSGPERVIVVEPHEERLQGFFPTRNTPDILWFTSLFASNVAHVIKETGIDAQRVVSVAADHGTKVRVTEMTRILRNVHGLDISPNYAIIEKDRTSPDTVELMSFEGSKYLEGAIALLPDDLCASGRTFTQAAQACKDAGAIAALCMASHPTLTMDKNRLPKLLHMLNEPDCPIDGMMFGDILNMHPTIRRHPLVWSISTAETLALSIHNAWGVPFPGAENEGRGSHRGFNAGMQEPLTPQPIPSALMAHLVRKLKAKGVAVTNG